MILKPAVTSLAFFGSLNLLVGLLSSSYDANATWLSWSQQGAAGKLLIAGFAVAVLGWSWWRNSPWASATARVAVALVAMGAAVDTAAYYAAMETGHIHSEFPIPLSLGVAALLSWWSLRPPGKVLPAARKRLARGALATITTAACGALWVFLIIQCTGATSYARQTDAIVVLGARVYEDGRASLALEDRVHTACSLYQKGLASHIVMSGGFAADAPTSEPEAMRALAEARGVPRSAISLDLQGKNTRCTVESLKSLARAHNWRSIMAVTHDYHCSRVWLTAHQAGLRVLTVPATESRPLPKKPKFVAREVLAWGWYWISGSVGLL